MVIYSASPVKKDADLGRRPGNREVGHPLSEPAARPYRRMLEKPDDRKCPRMVREPSMTAPSIAKSGPCAIISLREEEAVATNGDAGRAKSMTRALSSPTW